MPSNCLLLGRFNLIESSRKCGIHSEEVNVKIMVSLLNVKYYKRPQRAIERVSVLASRI